MAETEVISRTSLCLQFCVCNTNLNLFNFISPYRYNSKKKERLSNFSLSFFHPLLGGVEIFTFSPIISDTIKLDGLFPCRKSDGGI